jgi:hypothetical protein
MVAMTAHCNKYDMQSEHESAKAGGQNHSRLKLPSTAAKICLRLNPL